MLWASFPMMEARHTTDATVSIRAFLLGLFAKFYFTPQSGATLRSATLTSGEVRRMRSSSTTLIRKADFTMNVGATHPFTVSVPRSSHARTRFISSRILATDMSRSSTVLKALHTRVANAGVMKKKTSVSSPQARLSI